MPQRGQAVAVTARAPRAPLLSLVVSLVLVSPITALVVWPQARTGLLPHACAAHPRCAVAGAATSPLRSGSTQPQVSHSITSDGTPSVARPAASLLQLHSERGVEPTHSSWFGTLGGVH